MMDFWKEIGCRPTQPEPDSPPPSFSSGSPPPSFTSSPPTSPINGDGRSSLEIPRPPKATLKKYRTSYKAGQTYTENKGYKGIESSKEKPILKVIPELDELSPPPSYIPNPPKRRSNRRCCIGIVVGICTVFVVLAVVIPVIIIVGKPGSHGSVVANTTTTVTVGSTFTRVSSSIVTTTVPTSFTTRAFPTSSTPTATPTSTFLGGFDALEFGDQTMWMFYTDQQKNIKQIQASADTYAIRSYWRPGYPEIVSTGVNAGSSIQVIGTRNLTTGIRSEIHLFFVGEDGKIKELTTSATTGYISSYPIAWGAGSLSALNIEVSDAMFLRVCTPWATSHDYTSTAADLYIYYSSKDGGVKKLGWWKVQPSTWFPLNETSQFNSHGSIECQNDYGSTENMWMVNQNSQLEQWTHNSTDSSSPQIKAKRDVPTAANWTRALVYGLRSVNPQTNILSITSTLQSLGGRTHIFYQDSNNTIRRLDVNGIGANAWVQNDAIVDQGTPGTRLTTTNSSSTYCGNGAGVTIYYQRNTSEIMYYTFTDLYSTGGMASTLYNGSPLYSSTKVETYGLAPGIQDQTGYGLGSGGGGTHFSLGSIFGIVVGVFVVIGLLGGCCCG